MFVGHWRYFCMDCDCELTYSQVHYSNRIYPKCETKNTDAYMYRDNYGCNRKAYYDYVHYRSEWHKIDSYWIVRLLWAFIGYVLGLLTGLFAYSTCW